MTELLETVTSAQDPGIRHYHRVECVVFYKTREAFGGLSNMSAGFRLQINDISVPSSEALYQACRFPHMPHVQRSIITQASPMTAKMKSKPHRAATREDWELVKVAIMKWCLKVKLAQHWHRFGDLLLSTSSRPIVEQSRKDHFWGAVPEPGNEVLVGSNVLGRLLMGLRERMRERPSEFDRVEPLPIQSFLLLGAPIPSIERLEQDIQT